jgi:hypothetical protein
MADQSVVCSEQAGYYCEPVETIEIDVKLLSTIKPKTVEPITDIKELQTYHLGPRRILKEIWKDRKNRRRNILRFNRPELRDMLSERNQRFFLI